MIDLPYLYESNVVLDSNKILLVLPDIFGFNTINIELFDELSHLTGYKTFGLNYFYKHTNEKIALNPETQTQEAVKLMQAMTGEGFIEIFNKTVDEIIEKSSHISEIAVCGFCFGGRLALLSAVNEKVGKIVSFYGAGTSKPNFYRNQSVIEVLGNDLEHFKNQEFLCYYGGLDESITLADRVGIAEILTLKSKSFKEILYNGASHAFFNKGRVNFAPEIYEDAVNNLINFLK